MAQCVARRLKYHVSGTIDSREGFESFLMILDLCEMKQMQSFENDNRKSLAEDTALSSLVDIVITHERIRHPGQTPLEDPFSEFKLVRGDDGQVAPLSKFQTGCAEIRLRRSAIRPGAIATTYLDPRLSFVIQPGCLVNSSDGDVNATIQVSTFYMSLNGFNMQRLVKFAVAQRAAVQASPDSCGVNIEMGIHGHNNEKQFEDQTKTYKIRKRKLYLALMIVTGTSNRNTDNDFNVS